MKLSEHDLRFLRLCDQVRKESHDPDRKVGVVIVDSVGRQLSVGTNEPPRLLRLTAEESRIAIQKSPAWKYFMLEHAERNAIFAAYSEGTSLVGATMYATLFPCADCARAIVAAGLSRLVVLGHGQETERDAKWIEHYKHAEMILALAGVTVEIVDQDDVM